MMNEKELFNTLYNKYNKLFLNKEEICKELNISQATLNRRLKAQEALPAYEKDGGKYLFSIMGLAQYTLAINALNSHF
ncbi:hypothetical protein PT447_00245 [Aliarcobacter butzleri]|uniref:hypothetical protein n=1 Tax=Aliarcobacter butzleri TaxID=28197 RepID=UPI0024DE6F1E|nr:hypothetical protein [Aliarcobacter butzleri]MDK2063349.1 hypothetical protein [Aliarcobacter butzleri]